jgi:hypothetical protein
MLKKIVESCDLQNTGSPVILKTEPQKFKLVHLNTWNMLYTNKTKISLLTRLNPYNHSTA